MTNFNHDRRTLWWVDQQRRMELERGKHRGEPHFLPLTPPQKVFNVSCFILLFICVSVDLVFLCCFPCLFLIFSLVYVIAFYFWETSETLRTLTTLKTWWPGQPGWSWWFQRIPIWDLLLSGEMNVITFFFEETDSPLTEIWRIQDNEFRPNRSLIWKRRKWNCISVKLGRSV